MSALLLVSEVAERLRCSVQNIYNLISDGALKCYRVGRGQKGYRVSEAQLEEYLASTEEGQVDLEEYPHLR